MQLQRQRSGFDKLCGYAHAWINTLSWFVGALTETQKVLICPQLSSLLLACLKLLLGPKRSQIKGQSAARKQYPYWKNMWLHFDSFLKRKQQLRPRIYTPTGDERSKIALFRVLEVPLLLNICIVPSCRRVPNGIHFDSWGRIVRSVIDGKATDQSFYRMDVLAVKKRKRSATISLIIYVCANLFPVEPPAHFAYKSGAWSKSA